MEAENSPLDAMPPEMKFMLMGSFFGKKTQSDVIFPLLQINTEFYILGQDPLFWEDLSKKEGVVVIPSKSLDVHKRYHKVNYLFEKHKNEINLSFLEWVIQNLNYCAAHLHGGAIKMLLGMMNSKDYSFDQEFIFLPEWLDKEEFPLVSIPQLLKLPDRELIQHYIRAPQIIHRSSEIYKRFGGYLDSHGLNFLKKCYAVVASKESLKKNAETEFSSMFLDFVANKDLFIQKVGEYQDNRIHLEILKDYLENLFGYFTFFTSKKGSHNLTGNQFQQIKAALDESDDCLKEISLDKKESKEYSDIVLNKIRSGQLSHLLIDSLNDYCCSISDDDSSEDSKLLLLYSFFLQAELYIQYPQFCFANEVLGNYIYSEQMDGTKESYVGNLSYKATPLDIRQFIKWTKLATLSCDDHCFQQVFLFFEDFNPHFFKEVFPEEEDHFKFLKQHIGCEQVSDYISSLWKIHNEKIFNLLMNTNDEEDLSILYEGLAKYHVFKDEYPTAEYYAQKAYQINPEEYVSFLFELYVDWENIGKAQELLESEITQNWCLPETIQELEERLL